ncbi:MAG TPA: glycosyltransferase family 4 protein, partial [Acidimicrobiales bacterium]|nr:glycosyltransferase family 4 protein [Acidimicrobiales bacterium]
LDAARIDVVYNGIVADDYPVGGAEELARARAELGIDPGAFVVLFCGRLDAEKGLEVLLDAWGRLGLAPAEGRLVILGLPVLHPDPQAYLRQLRELAPPGCLWLPTRRGVVDVMHAADVLVLPSYAEGFGRALIEAMATGRPAVGSRVEGIPEILSGDFARFLFEPGDAAGLTDLLAGLVGWQAREPGLAAQCAQYVRERFSLGRTADGVEGVLTEVLSGRGRRPRRRSGPGGDARRSA